MNRIALLSLGILFCASASAQQSQVDEYALKATEINTPNPIASPNDVQSYSADTTGGTSWDRPFADGTCCSGLGPVVLHSQQFSISANDTCNVRSVQDGWDGYLFIYVDPFDPLNQTVNFVAGDDDGAGGIGTSDIDGVALTGGTVYQIVTTGFEAGEEGTFTNTITCPVANVTIGGGGGGVPFEPPATLPTLGQNALIILGMLVGLLGFVAIRRRA
ncbi:hypothetical protein [Dokdonella immobilis]|uniref:IPTL-CTERM protein sorting domain-containing protein n=1 Tax=Dokdonella immobilis TaxID=578942 RepID=A0A1I4VTX5_9GAMM|nr:hypothetical protein [Dokdonella immobilis]SFN04704.1 IPTL-CTERM protein sorting domain-containing protein [Dokdonella immobilis]